MSRTVTVDRDEDEDFEDKVQPSMEALARRYADQFFADKYYYLPDLDGEPQPVPKRKLYSKTCIDIILGRHDLPTFDLVTCYDLIDQAVIRHLKAGGQLMYRSIPAAPIKERNRLQVEFHLWLLQECSRCRIPKEFRGGIILLYTWLCEGVPFDIPAG